MTAKIVECPTWCTAETHRHYAPGDETFHESPVVKGHDLEIRLVRTTTGDGSAGQGAFLDLVGADDTATAAQLREMATALTTAAAMLEANPLP